MTAWNRSDGNLNHAWDLSLVGNWNSITRNSTIESRTHSVAHEITSIGANVLTHDSKGNLTAAADGRTFNWDFDNRLASATIPAAYTDGVEGTHTYTYDALGRRGHQNRGRCERQRRNCGHDDSYGYRTSLDIPND